MTERKLPAEASAALAAIEDRLEGVAAGEYPWTVVADEVELHVEAALTHAARSAALAGVPGDELDPVSVMEIVATNVRQFRAGAGWTQAKLASAMQGAGFDWKRITVAEVEGATRRLQLDELVALAAVFTVPMVELLMPFMPAPIRWVGGTTLAPEVYMELLIGEGGQAGEGGPGWPPAAVVAGAATAAGRVAPGRVGRGVLRNLRREAGR